MKEADIERKLCKDVQKKLHGIAIKLAPISCAGLPDRLLILPEGQIVFVECKLGIAALSKIQKAWVRSHAKLWASSYNYSFLRRC